MSVMRKSLPYVIITAVLGTALAAQTLLKKEAPAVPVTPSPAVTTVTETSSETSSNVGQCAYVWASHELPDTTEQIQKAVVAMRPDASASAQAYGEDCVYADGTSTFGAMETDFHFTFETNLTNEEELGNLIIQSMKLLKDYPPGTVPGPQLGRASFTFKQGVQEINLIVDIKKYNELPAGLAGQEVYNEFKTP